MALVGSPTSEAQPRSLPSSPDRQRESETAEEGDLYRHHQIDSLDWYQEDRGDEIIDAGGPSSVEVQPDLSSSPRSISLSQSSCHLDDDFDGHSPSCEQQALEAEGPEDLDIMGIANTWNDEDAYAPDGAVPTKGVELPCLALGQSASSGPWLSPGPLELFDDDRESVCELLGDVADSNSCPGVCGLRNLGNTCFMNAGLQCLTNTPPLLDFFLSDPVRQQLSGANGAAPVHLTSQFAAVLVKMWSGGFSTLRPTEFKHTLSLYHSQFKDYRQHDCQEFLALLLDSLHEQLSGLSVKTAPGLTSALPVQRNSVLAVSGGDADAHSMLSASDLTPECCLGLGLGLEMGPGEPMELYESSRSSQLSSPRSSDSAETSSSCTTSCSSSTAATRVKAAALSLRSLPIPEEVKQPMSPLVSAPAPPTDPPQSPPHLFDATRPPTTTLLMERNLLSTADEVTVTGPVLEKNLLSEISSMMKDSKTANVNVATESSSTANNEIYFDSGKFPPASSMGDMGSGKPLRPSTSSVQLVRNTPRGSPSGLLQASLKNTKVKMTNVLKEAAKRLGQSDDPLGGASVASPSAEEIPLTHTSPNNENSTRKKARMEADDKDNGVVTDANGESSSSVWSSLSALETAVKESEESSPSFYSSSQLHLRVESSSSKSSIVTDTFQGLFRSTVVCCTCKHVSVTYEPFMYLSVPLPRALERVVDVMFVPAGTARATRHQLVVQQYDQVAKLRQLLVKTLQLDIGDGQLVLVEVVNHHVARVLEDQLLLRHLKDGPYWTIYALHVPPPAPDLTPPEDQTMPAAPASADPSPAVEEPGGPDGSAPPPTAPWKTCSICLEEMADSELRKHTSCPCLLCQSCIEASCRHRSGNSGDSSRLQCPVCSVLVDPAEEFAPLDRLHCYRPVIRLLNVSLLFRVPSESGGSGSGHPWRLMGHPRLLQLPSMLSPAGLYRAVGDLFPKPVPFQLVLVDSQGMRCPRCVYPTRCHGCRIRKDEDSISLQPNDCLAVQALVAEGSDASTVHDTWQLMVESMQIPSGSDAGGSPCRLKKEPLTLDACLRAFSESETLDEGNPWFCPKCQKRQCASKTLNICQAPPYLIVYLKRFVFHDNTSSKLDNRVEFPLAGLSLQPYVDATLSSSDSASISSVGSSVGSSVSSSSELEYDLYGVVCHFGGASSGHYTAYTRHVQSGEWHYYNDETVLTRSPQEEDFSHGYVLFYQRRNSPTQPPAATCQAPDPSGAASAADVAK